MILHYENTGLVIYIRYYTSKRVLQFLTKGNQVKFSSNNLQLFCKNSCSQNDRKYIPEEVLPY